MELHMQNVFIAMGFAFIPVTGCLVTLLISARERARKAEALVHDLAIAPALRGERRGREIAPDHLTDAVDAIALEVERISEAQRFTTKLLSERLESRGTSVAPRSITPH
jgi:hypothetical protein